MKGWLLLLAVACSTGEPPAIVETTPEVALGSIAQLEPIEAWPESEQEDGPGLTLAPEPPPAPKVRSVRKRRAPVVMQKKAAGESCTSASECSTGYCEGQGCDDAHPGVCAKRVRACPASVELCSCSGQTFTAPATCAKQRYAHVGACGG